LVDCSVSALMRVDELWKLKKSLEDALAVNPQDKEAQAKLAQTNQQLQNDLGSRAGASHQGGSGIPGPLEVRGGQALASPSSLPVYEAFGYAGFFQAAEHPGGHHGARHPQHRPLLGEPGQLDGVGLEPAIPPGGVLARAPHHRRPGGVLPPVRPRLPLPAPRGARPAPGVPPYVLPFALERTHWRWVSVPEGYEVPGVRGTPYKPLSDLFALTSLVDLSALYQTAALGGEA
jgi:hypothetical protein